MIIGVLGHKYNGKDTIADHLVEKYKFKKICFAHALKDMAKQLFGLTDEQLYGEEKEVEDEYWKTTPRKLLQFVGTELFRKQFSKLCPHVKEGIWVEIVKKKLLNTTDNIVISDVRFQNELDMIHNLNGIIIKVKRPSIKKVDYHESELGIDKIKDFDIEILNNDTLVSLYDKIDKVMLLHA